MILESREAKVGGERSGRGGERGGGGRSVDGVGG